MKHKKMSAFISLCTLFLVYQLILCLFSFTNQSLKKRYFLFIYCMLLYWSFGAFPKEIKWWIVVFLHVFDLPTDCEH